MDHNAYLTSASGSARPDALRPMVHLHTGSDEKRRQYRYLFAELGLELMPAPAGMPDKREPQIEDCGAAAEKLLVAKPLDDVAELVEREGLYPFVVEDTMLFIEHFNGNYANEKILPGADTKRWWRALGADGVLALMGDTETRSAQYVCQLAVLLGPGERRCFRAEVDGSIALRVDPPASHSDAPPGDFPRNTFFHSIFIPEGATATLAGMDQGTFLRHDYRRRCLAGAAAPILTAARQGVTSTALRDR